VLDSKANSTYIAHRQREVYIYRNNQVVFGGDMIVDSGSVQFTADDMFTVSGKGFLDRLNFRYSAAGFEETNDAAAVCMELFLATDAIKSTGIIAGVSEASVVRDVQADQKKLFDVFSDLSSMKDGFDFEVTQTKVLNFWFPKGDITNVVFNDKNIQRLDFTHDFTNPCNEAIVVGQNYGAAMPVQISDDTNLQASYGLFQDKISDKDAIDNQQLLDDGAQEILLRGTPQLQLKITQEPGSDPDWTTLDVGDWVGVNLQHGFLNIFTMLRILIIEVSVNDGVEQVVYTLGIQ
jgi:hypothetical protein